MRRPAAAVLLSTVAATSVLAASLPRGVGPEFAKFYGAQGTFSCIGHPKVILKSSQINDGSCDCPDGSDEPGTAACSNLNPLSPPQPLASSTTGTTNTTNVLPGFWCENKGHVGQYVPFIYVNDGVCDYDLCCDGSEEYGHVGGKKCENRCDAIGKEYRRVEAETKARKEKAIKKRRTLVKEAKELRRRVEAKITSLKAEVAGLETKKTELEQKLTEIEKSERGKVVKTDGQTGKLGILVAHAKQRVNELRTTLDKMVDQRDDYRERVDKLEEILRNFKQEYNPNFNDEGVKSAVKAWEDYAAVQADAKESDIVDTDVLEVLKEDNESSGVNWKEFEDGEEVSDTDILYKLEAYLPGFVQDFVHGRLALLRVWMIENGILADNPAKGGESKLITAARDAFQAVANDLGNKQRDVDEQENDLQHDYGTDDIFRALKGKCISVDSGEYEYEHCFLDKTTQKPKKGGGNTSLGNFVRIDTEIADEEEVQDGKSLGKGPRIVLKYENGQGCWNGPARSTAVWLACSETDELWKVAEAEKCVYKMEVGTPAVCEDLSAANGRTKDEL